MSEEGRNIVAERRGIRSLPLQVQLIGLSLLVSLSGNSSIPNSVSASFPPIA